MPDPTLSLARTLLERMGAGAPVDAVDDILAEDLVFEVAGDATALPWIGPSRTGREAFRDFVRDQRALLRPEAFAVDDILHNETRAVILGNLASTVARTAKTIRTHFAIVLTVADGRISRFQMLEDSHAVSRASH